MVLQPEEKEDVMVRFSRAKRSIITNGFTGICLTKIDVLDTFKEIKVCVDYNNKKPIYETYQGWKQVLRV